jgi:hypothetical protein
MKIVRLCMLALGLCLISVAPSFAANTVIEPVSPPSSDKVQQGTWEITCPNGQVYYTIGTRADAEEVARLVCGNYPIQWE